MDEELKEVRARALLLDARIRKFTASQRISYDWALIGPPHIESDGTFYSPLKAFENLVEYLKTGDKKLTYGGSGEWEHHVEWEKDDVN